MRVEPVCLEHGVNPWMRGSLDGLSADGSVKWKIPSARRRCSAEHVPGLARRQVGAGGYGFFVAGTGGFAGAAPALAGAVFPCVRRKSPANSLISVRSRCSSLQPYHMA